MSAKIFAITQFVDNYKEKASAFLHLPITDDDGEFYSIGDYQVSFSLDDIIAALSYTDAIPYYCYFDKEESIRIQCFDMIRAFGLHEMWVCSEHALDGLLDDRYTLASAIAKMQEDYTVCHEFIKEEIDAKDAYSFYHDTFADLFRKVEEIERKFNVQVLGLCYRIDPNTGEKLIRVLKNGEVWYMNQESGRLTKLPNNQ